VANMSLGTPSYSYALKDAVDYVISRGVVVVAAAGNSYRRIAFYPAAFNGVISVAASTPRDEKADFSCIGWWNSVAAPGERILSVIPNNNYRALNGTSMAAPFVAGAAALLLAEYPGLKPVEVMNQIEQTARGNGFSEELGYGILDLAAYGAAGEDGSHIFHALHPGEYVVSVTHYDEAAGTWEVSSKPISLGIGEEVEVRFQFGS
jgi:subtilisin family serine protease